MRGSERREEREWGGADSGPKPIGEVMGKLLVAPRENEN